MTAEADIAHWEHGGGGLCERSQSGNHNLPTVRLAVNLTFRRQLELPQFELEEGENVEIEFVKVPDYARHPNQLAAVTDRRFLFIKRKEFSKYPYALEYFPIGAWSSLKYRSSLALASMLAGLIIVIFGFLIVYFRYTGELQGGPSLGLALLMLALGGAMTIGVRRHKLALVVGDRTLTWKSPPLKFSEYLPAIRQLVDLASSRGIPVHGRPKPASDSETPPYLRD